MIECFDFMVVSWSIGARPNTEVVNSMLDAFIESRLKTEMFFARDWLSTSIEEFVAAVDAYIRWYNEFRIKRSLEFRSTAEHRRCQGTAA